MWKILAYMVLKVLKLGEITLGQNIKRNVGWEIESREEQVRAIYTKMLMRKEECDIMEVNIENISPKNNNHNQPCWMLLGSWVTWE